MPFSDLWQTLTPCNSIMLDLKLLFKLINLRAPVFKYFTILPINLNSTTFQHSKQITNNIIIWVEDQVGDNMPG